MLTATSDALLFFKSILGCDWLACQTVNTNVGISPAAKHPMRGAKLHPALFSANSHIHGMLALAFSGFNCLKSTKRPSMDRREKRLTRGMGTMLLVLAVLSVVLDSPLSALIAGLVGIMCLVWSFLENWLDRE
ncbi:hypothetical protein [Noviherbaspirillum aerium]|uniref:hypothetical protein n=1 Tax=Noviherbaspirillum aerium TaxID=2588497 RepID=UPI00124EAB05|nr:hypothetical protein [Noviherbaspirillum aerium]